MNAIRSWRRAHAIEPHANGTHGRHVARIGRQTGGTQTRQTGP